MTTEAERMREEAAKWLLDHRPNYNTRWWDDKRVDWDQPSSDVADKVIEVLASALPLPTASARDEAERAFTKACAEWHADLDANRGWPKSDEAIERRNAIVDRRNKAWRAWQAIEAERGAE